MFCGYALTKEGKNLSTVYGKSYQDFFFHLNKFTWMNGKMQVGD